MSKYAFTPECREVSGFGGDYEQACRTMIQAGMDWIDAHPGASLVYVGYYSDNSPDMQALEKQVQESVDCPSGAMMACTLNHIMFAHKNGWDKYLAELSSTK